MPCFDVQRAELVAEHHALGAAGGSAEGYGEALRTRKLAALGDGADKWSAELIEFLWRNDKHITLPRLLTAVDRVQVDVVNVTPIHQIASRPAGPSSSQSVSSAVIAPPVSPCLMRSSRR